MKELALSRGYVALVDDEDYDRFSAHKWSASEVRTKNGTIYAVRSLWLGNGRRQKRIYLHRAIMEPLKGIEVDHVNGDGLDNRRANLRLATGAQNRRNNRRPRGKTGFKGVYFDPRSSVRPFFSAIQNVRIGAFATAEEAALAYNNAALERFGEFATLNLLYEKGGVVG